MSAIDKPSSSHQSRSWDSLKPPLSEWILDAVSAMGFRRMTPVQASAIPLFMDNKDVVVEAVTGSGKTFAFLVPVVERILRMPEPLKQHHVAAIVVSPTRELAAQTYSVLQSLLAFHGPSAAAMTAANDADDGSSSSSADESGNERARPALYPPGTRQVVPQLVVGGGSTPAADLAFFLRHSPNLLVATPGRLLELLASPRVRMPQASFEALVLDEADRLLDLGFREDLQRLLARLPKQRRTGLFSASVSEAVDELVRVGLRNPVKIAVKVKGQAGGAEQRTPTSLQMRYLVLPPSHKLPAVAQLLRRLDPVPTRIIIYLATCVAVDYFQHVLPAILKPDPATSTGIGTAAGGPAAGPDEPIALIPLHGKHPPAVRQRNFARFAASVGPTVLLTTDLAARGLDVPQVDLVVQVDPPGDPRAFLHRCGRAGRAGRAGLGVVLLSPGAEEDYVPFLAVRKTPVAPLVTDPPLDVSAADAEAATARIRATVRADRALHDRAQRAFVSWVRAYTKHEARAIFRVGALDWAELARAWGLLRLPRMPERRAWPGDETLGLAAELAACAYRDPARERQRQEALAETATGGDDGGGGGGGGPARSAGKKREGEGRGAWSRKEQQQADKTQRREKRKLAKEQRRRGRMTSEERQQEEELAELLREAKRQRRLEQEEFEGFSE